MKGAILIGMGLTAGMIANRARLERLSWWLSHYRNKEHPLSSLAHLRRFQDRLRNSRLLQPYADGGLITLDLRDFVQRDIFVTGSHEPEVWDTLSRFASDNEVVWDIGAHIGSFAIRAALHPAVREVHCFEPDPRTMEILRLNLMLNQKRTFCHAIALSDRQEERQLYRGPATNQGLGTLQTNLGHGAIPVSCLTVDDVIAQGVAPAPTLLKLDVEDWEERVLMGAQRLLESAPPKAIVFEAEVNPDMAMANQHLAELLTDLGYQVSPIHRPSGEVQNRENFLAHHVGR